MSKLFGDDYDDDATIDGAKNPDTPGVYWQRMDRCSVEEKFDDGQDYVKLWKTTVYVVEAASEQAVGDETTEAFFKRKKTTFFERETKALAQAVLGLSKTQANSLTGKQVGYLLLDPKRQEEWIGGVIEVRVGLRTDKEDKSKHYVFCQPKRRVPYDELIATLDKKTLRKFFSDGVTEDPDPEAVMADPKLIRLGVSSKRDEEGEDRADRAARRPRR